jgi:tRNA threonylcarbamoyladenosine biosynthesis protein TsaE
MIIDSEKIMLEFAEHIGRQLVGGEVIELIGDVGAGKTTFTKGLAKGLGVEEVIQSPTFTISREYDARDGLRLSHYDFYRLHDAGIMADELHETIADPRNITVVEWAEVVDDVLPAERITIRIIPSRVSETSRDIEIIFNVQEFPHLKLEKST